MKIAILETGAPPDPLKPAWGGYPGMFEAMLTSSGVAAATAAYDVREGRYPDRVEDHDAYLITGSSAGVYDDLPWIEPLKGFLRSAKGRAKLVGVCFGHQVMAEAFGGRVIKSPKGWGVGLHRYDILSPQAWMEPVDQVAIPVSHQDQVVELPPGAQVIGGSAFTPFGMLAYADQPAISFQPHPEFDPAYAAALIEGRRGARYTEDQADAAIASLRAPNDRARVGDWIRRFLEG